MMGGVLRTVSALIVVAALSSPGQADGGVFATPPAAQRAAVRDVKTPDQRALLRWDADTGTETLVIETTLQGGGTDFAWILPLPAEPEICASTTGLFPTLGANCTVDVWTDTTPWWTLVLVAGAGVVVAMRIPTTGGRVAALAAMTGAVACGYNILVTSQRWDGADGLTLARYLSYGDGATRLPESRSAPVRVLSRRTVGVLDTVVLAAADAGGLRRWLDENGFHAPASIDAAVEAYVAEGWVFVASRLRAEEAADVRNIDPLAFTFPAAAPVYPMRLTGALNESLRLELYVFADRRAASDGLEATHCFAFDDWAVPGVERFTSDAEIRRCAGDSKGLTRLEGSLSGDELRRDLTFDWTALDEDRPFVFAPAAVAPLALTAAALVLAAGWIVGAARTTPRTRPGEPRPPRRTLRLVAITAMAAVAAFGVVSLALPVAGPEVVLPGADEPDGPGPPPAPR